MCFIGDDKQRKLKTLLKIKLTVSSVPPYGQEDLQDLQSIFEVPHLRRLCLFLDTQCISAFAFTLFVAEISIDRMPPQIGEFISSNVYESKLNSNPKHPITNSTVACQFIDVVSAKEQPQATGTSIIVCGLLSAFLPLTMPQSILESEAVIKLAWHLQENEKNYKIITPYDAQRVLIEDRMKETEGLHWEEKVVKPTCFSSLLRLSTLKVYNVDSFQGLFCLLCIFFFPQLIFHS
jgi:regulator of nonsense transcripts 1